VVKANLRVHLDEREGFSPGWKFNDWEMRGRSSPRRTRPQRCRQAISHVGPTRSPRREEKVSASLADLPATIENCLWKFTSRSSTRP